MDTRYCFDKMSCSLYITGRVNSHGNDQWNFFLHLKANSGLHCIDSGNTSKAKRAREEANYVKL